MLQSNGLKRAIIFGAGNNYIYGLDELREYYEIVGVMDNDPNKQGKVLRGYTVESVDDCLRREYDLCIATPSNIAGIRDDLIAKGVDPTKITDMKAALSEVNEPLQAAIAILCYGGLGDIIIARNWICHLDKKYNLSECIVDIYVDPTRKSDAEAVFLRDDQIRDIRSVDIDLSELIDTKGYDLIIRYSILPEVTYMNDRRLYVGHSLLYHYASELREYGFEHYNRGFFASPGFYHTVRNEITKRNEQKYHSYADVFLDLSMSDEYLYTMEIAIDEDEYLKSVSLFGTRYVLLDTGLNQEYSAKKSTRDWGHNAWDSLAQTIKKEFPDLVVVQAGLRQGKMDDISADICLNGRTSIEEIKVLLKHAMLMIDYDGGLVHLRHVLGGGATVVLMGPSGIDTHAYEENIYIRSDVCEEPCEWTTSDWLSVCPKGYDELKCMRGITPQMVIDTIRKEGLL